MEPFGHEEKSDSRIITLYFTIITPPVREALKEKCQPSNIIGELSMKVIVCKVSKNRYQHFAIQVYPISFIPAKFQTTSIRILIYCCRVSRVSFIGTDEERRLDSNVGWLVLNWIMIYLNGILFFVLVFFNQGNFNFHILVLYANDFFHIHVRVSKNFMSFFPFGRSYR